MNILLTSAGRRTYLIEYFKDALEGRGLVFASNSQMSPALKAADGYFLTPLIYDDSYIPFLLEKCREHSIGMLISLYDIDLPVLSLHRSEFDRAGVFLGISDYDTIKFCNDKYAMFSRLWRIGLKCPETEIYLDEAILKADAMAMHFPMLLKPRYGMGSLNMLKVYDKRELKSAYGMLNREIMNGILRYESAVNRNECVIMQEIVEGDEYGLDVICGFDGRYLKTIVRKKLAMRSGETDEAVILGVNDPEYGILCDVGEKIAAGFKPKGLIDVDVLMYKGNMRPYVIDINARFGGGYPFSHLAGADVPRAYIQFYEGKNDKAMGYLNAKAGVHGYKDISMKIY